ncbi:MAG: type II toxin-antitoxin system death-on-curing family toxin [Vampirovibrionales bacterium]
MTCYYFELKQAIHLHSLIITHSGGLPGVKEEGLLDSTLQHMKNDSYYPDFLDKLTHLVFSINKNHAFNDGNKRASIALSALF